ncbi:MAG: biotin--[acetyl-CoA-carboxylase] ligase [Chlamydiae bacterium CG10_big_fil_rev_8_21_14_0_10_42_34]|nr:MAG: biotin--[acetyl-CoA-carboxylase] ligase [Chlamydiae bacterium CG10_big_fil_rev_8_21_14_0_10_42_34]
MHEIHLSLIDSTNTYAKIHAETFPQNQITCITAEEQSAGRGRYQRTWLSPRGANIYATFYFTLPLNTAHLISLAQVMASSFANVLINEGFSPKIKWPNDIQVNGKKISGILCETQFCKDHVDLFLGIGINVNLDEQTALKIDQPATSLLIETGKNWDKKELLKKLQVQFEKDLETFKEDGFSPFHKQFESLLAKKGETIRCFDGKKMWEGICHSLTAEGQLNILLSDQTIHTITSGDIK